MKDIVEFLALDVADVENLVTTFKEMDEDSSGNIDITELFDFVEEDRNVFGDKLFEFLDESHDGELDFPVSKTLERTERTFVLA